MAGDLLSIGVSGLLAFQRALSTTGHNVANVNTPWYSRQGVELSAPLGSGPRYLGSGVEVEQIRRSYDSFINTQVHAHTSTHSRFEVFRGLASRVDELLGDSQAGLTPALQDFFAAIQGVSNEPASIPARQVVLSEAFALADRFHSLDGQLSTLSAEVNTRLQGAVTEINGLASSLASFNQQIVAAQSVAGGQPPNDLLDQRDALLAQLAEHIATTVLAQADGSVNVLTGSGQALVLGSSTANLGVAPAPADPSQLELTYEVGHHPIVITDSITGGALGGLLDFRKQVLAPAQNALGRIALALAQTFNAQHREGMDLEGQLGKDFFTAPMPLVLPHADNKGNASLALAVSDVSALTSSDYELSYDGVNYLVRRLADDDAQTLTGGGPFVIDGMTVSITGTPSAEDRYLIRPTRGGAAGFQVALSDTGQIAAALPIRTLASVGNLGEATVSAGEVLNASHPDLLRTLRIQFNDPPSTFNVVDVATSTLLLNHVGYPSGADIQVNGLRVQIGGNPQAGDSFTVERNTAGSGDNRNALLLGALQFQQILEGGTATYQAAYGQLISAVGTRAHQADLSYEAQAALLEQAQETRESIAGVNLDEEAAHMLRFQQSYQAAAQVVAMADTLFQTLLKAVAR
jgi:flagellar hook-associated protein 1 FlgK